MPDNYRVRRGASVLISVIVRRGAALLLVLALAVGTTGCVKQWLAGIGGGGGGSSMPTRQAGVFGGTWSEIVAHVPSSLDPSFAVTAPESRAAALVFGTLLRMSPEGQVLPDMAADWRVLDAGKTYEFRLRDDLVFHDGSPITADDVVFSLRRLLDPEVGSPRSWLLDGVAGAEAFAQGLSEDLPGVEAVSEQVVRIRLVRAYVQFPLRLTMPAAGIVSRRSPPTAGVVPVGSGPFRWSERAADGSLVLSAFDDYYAGRPYLDTVRLLASGGEEATLQQFVAGGVQVLDLTPTAAQRLQQEFNWHGELERVVQPAVYYLALNNQKPPLNDPLVRRAIALAIDRKAILEAVMPEGYVLANGAIPPGISGHNPNLAGIPYDPQQARLLMRQAGLADGFDLDLVQTASPMVQAINSRIRDALDEIGVRVRVRTLSSADFFAAVGRHGDASAFIISWWADYPDGENFLYPLFHSQHWGEAGNRAKFARPEIDQLLAELHTAVGAKPRLQLYQQVEQAVFERVPWVPLFFPVRYRAMQPDLRGYEVNDVYNAEKLWAPWLDQN